MVKQAKEIPLDFEVDELTNSIINAITGEVFETEIIKLTKKDSKRIKKSDWIFNWKEELKDTTKEIYKLTTIHNQTTIHGLISLSDKEDHLFMNLIENAKFNKGVRKLYKGVAGNLAAFGCKMSFERGYDGILAFIAKTQLVEHYKKTIGAKQLSASRMYIDTKEALTLTHLYFKDFTP